MSNIPKILEDKYLKNLRFFKNQNPQIHQVLSNTTPDHTKIIITDDGKVDLTYNGRNIYGGDAISYAEDEVKEFNGMYKSDKRISAIKAIAPGIYTAPHFFHKHLDETVTQMYQTAGTIKANVIHTENRHDFLIIMGIGLGLHITELLENTNVQNILILETDHELLALSCFFTDWEDVYEKQSTSKNKSISLVLVDKQSFDTEHGSLWNELIKRAPHFPYNTVFYNHGRHDKYGEILRKVTTDIRMFISLWGFYDDEVNQLNHIMHNINNKIKLIPRKKDFIWNKPVIVCGSGPSLDGRVDQLKSIRNNCILISAGSSIDVLLNNNLIPDYHVELESDYLVYNMLKNLDSKKCKKITLICAIQCSPLLTELFMDSYAFIKDSLAIGGALEKTEDKLKDPTPTCVNAAISFAFHYKAQEIFLFGTDFGFYNINEHHSKESIYHSEDDSGEGVKDLQENTHKMMNENFIQPGYKGDCLTTGTYYATKRRLDMLINFNIRQYKFNLSNCSDGLIIDKSNHIDQDSDIEFGSSIKFINKHEFENKSRLTNDDMKIRIEETLYPPIKDLCITFHNHISQMDNDIEVFSATCWALSNYINTTFQNKYGVLMYFIRGTVWHYTLSGYSVAYACEPSKQEEVIGLWKERFLKFLELLPKDLLENLKKDRSSMASDDRLRKTIRE